MVPAAVLLLIALQAPATPPALRVRLLAPTVGAAEPGLQLLRAELGAGGFLVEERPAPGPAGLRWLEQLRDAELFAAVVPDPQGARAAAVVLVYAIAGTRPRRHEIDLGDVAALPEPEGLRRLTALSVRVAEVLQAHVRERASPAAAGSIATAAPPAPGGERSPGNVRLHAGLAAGGAVTGEGSAVGPWLGIALAARRGPLVRLSVVGPSLTRALEVPAGRVRVWGTQGLLELGWAHGSDGRISSVVALAAGLQHVLAVGRPAPGFAAADAQTFSPAVGVSLGLGLRLSPHVAAVAGLRIQRLFRRPEIWIDTTQVAAAPTLLSAISLGLEWSP